MWRLSVLVVILFTSCIDTSDEPAEPADGSNKVDRFFPRFPDQQFEFICLGDETKKVIEDLNKNGYELKADQQNQFRNDARQIEIILPQADIVYSFRVFLFKKYDISCYEQFLIFFTRWAKSKSISDEFSVFDFETEEQDFSITIFHQPDFIRLNYELKIAH